MYLSENFLLKEFTCRCGRGECDAPKRPHPALIERLEELRSLWGKPLVINSGIRCDWWNAFWKGAPKSQHILGKAADIRVKDKRQAQTLASLAEQVGFKGIGVGETKLHLDVRAGKPAKWEY